MFLYFTTYPAPYIWRSKWHSHSSKQIALQLFICVWETYSICGLLDYWFQES